jgi:hypothetical protein
LRKQLAQFDIIHGIFYVFILTTRFLLDYWQSLPAGQMWGSLFPQNMTAAQIRSMVVRSLNWATNGLSVHYSFSAAPCKAASGGCSAFASKIQVMHLRSGLHSAAPTDNSISF